MQNIDQIQWPGWNVVRLIGRGSFGAVYEIQRDVFGETEKAALKVITIPENGAEIDDLRVEGYDDESITSRFQSYLEDIVKEYSTMAKMKGHPNVVYCDDVKYVQHDDGIGWDIYIKMELLTPLVKTLGKTVSEDEVINIGIDMCNALALCKEQNIVHRDIKPQNIFVSKDGVYKLGDFGIAKTAERTTSGTKTGTYKYMAPEVYKSQPYGAAVDQYSLGMVLYWLLNERRTPFLPLPSAAKATTVTMEDAARKRRFDGEQIPPPAHGSKQLQAIVLRACAYDPKDRFASAAEMLEALKALKNGSASPYVAVPMGAAAAVAGGVAAGVAADELTTGTAGTVGRRRSNAEEEVTIGAFGAGAASAARQGSLQNAQPAGQQNNRVQQTQQTNKQHTATPITTPQKKVAEKKKKRGIGAWIAIAAGLVIVVGGVLLLALRKGSDLESLPSKQLDWAEWADELPAYVTDDNYSIEERTLYRSRNLETTSSTTSNRMDGWELYDTATGNGDYGAWSDWSATAVSNSDSRQVETQTRYRYRDKETTTSTASSLSSWTLYDTEKSFGSWSEWSDTPLTANGTLDVETRQVENGCRYEMGHWCAVYTDGFPGGSCSQNRPHSDYELAANHLGDQQFHSIGWFTSSSSTPEPNQVTSTPCSRGWDIYTATNIETIYKTQYRSRSITTTYYYYRWKDWSSWSTNAVSSNDNREVQTATFYRYRDRVTQPTYYFQRWTDWSDYTESPVDESDTVEVETKTQFRYKSKET